MSSRNITDLHLEFQPLVKKWKKLCTFEIYEPLIYMTYRPPEEQEELYTRGRSAPGNKVTNARAGKSWHQYGLALDFAVKIKSEVSWNNISLYTLMGHVGISLGMEWGGNWRSIKDYGHLEYHPNKTIEEAYGETISKGLDPRELNLKAT